MVALRKGAIVAVVVALGYLIIALQSRAAEFDAGLAQQPDRGAVHLMMN